MANINNFSDNVPRWLSMAELKIDYYTQFIKAWIPFNAWYMVSYFDPDNGRRSDRDIIDHVKNNSNPFRDRIINLLNGDDNSSTQFKFYLGQLHLQLEGHTVPDNENKLTFSALDIAKNTVTNHTFTFRNLTYRVTYTESVPRGQNKIKCEIFDTRRGNANICLFELLKWSRVDFLASSHYIALPAEKQEQLRLCFDMVNPKRPENIVLRPVRSRLNTMSAPPRSMAIHEESNLYFVDDSVLISKMVIEMLYRLRCILFHGEINPTEINQVIYEQAYQIQKLLINELR